MAQETLKDFSMNGVLGGLLLLCLLVFAIGFMAFNNPNGLDDGTGDVLSSSNASVYSTIYEVKEDSNSLLNITSNTNPEVSDLGSRDSVSTSYSATGIGKGSWDSAKILFIWVFTGTTGKLLLGVLGGLIGVLVFFLIVKFIKIGN